MPGLRDDHPAAGAVPCDAARLRRPESAGDDPVREVRPASAPQPAERALCAGRRRSEPVDAGRPGRRLHDRAAAAPRADRGACARCRAPAWRRHKCADPGEGQDDQGTHLDVCSRRPALRRPGAAGGAVLCLTRPAARTSRAASDGLQRHPAGRCLQRLRRAVRSLRAEGPITSALCWAHARRQFFELADIAANARRGKNAGAISPIALEAVRRIDALFEIERGINGVAAEERLRIRKEQSAPLLEALEAWLREQRAAYRARPRSPSRSTICSSVGIGSPASSTMAGSA